MATMEEDLGPSGRRDDSPAQEHASQEWRYRVYWRAHIFLSRAMRIDARVIDASLGGMELFSDVPFASGSQIRVVAAVPHPRDLTRSVMIELPSVVQYHSLSGTGFRIGARFQQLPSGNRLLLEQALRKLGAR